MNDRMKTNARSAIYAMAGIYLAYLAYQMYDGRADSVGTEYTVVMIAAAAFLIIGAGMIAFGLYTMYKARKQDKDALEEHTTESEN